MCQASRSVQPFCRAHACRHEDHATSTTIGNKTHERNRLTALFPGLPGWAGTRNIKPMWIILSEARDSEWQWHQLGHNMQVCTSLQTDNHASTPPLSFFTGRMPFLPPNQQRQSTEGLQYVWRVKLNSTYLLTSLPWQEAEEESNNFWRRSLTEIVTSR